MKPKVVILCGGKGMRLREETENKPKPLLSVGKYPLLWHIMTHYAHYGIYDFILCLGYKGDLIKEYFLNYQNRWDLQLNLKEGTKTVLPNKDRIENWNITFAHTGPETNTGGRVKRIEQYIDGDYFFLTYGDGLSNINRGKLEAFFLKKGKTGVITGIRPPSRFGQVTADSENIVTGFKEKPLRQDYINGGFCVFSRKLFGFLEENCVLEQEVFDRLTNERQLALYKHEGFWKCMDTYKDYLELNKMWEHGDSPWMVRQNAV